MQQRTIVGTVRFLMVLACLAEGVAAPGRAVAQTNDVQSAVRHFLEQADAVAGYDPMLRILRNYHCYYVDPVPAPFRPGVMDETDFLFGTPILDNVTYLGYLNLAVFAVETSAGLVLIDGGGTQQQGERILVWLDKAGFERSDLKWIILTHEHGDHIAGAQVLREATGAGIVASAAAEEAAGSRLPPVDLAVDGRSVLTVGDSEFVLLPTPGHSPGTLSVFAPVHVDGDNRVASFWGGKGMRPNVDNLRQMLESVEVFAAESETLGAEVPLNTHSWGDGTISRLIEKVLAPEVPNPFVLTPTQNEANLELLRLCTAAYLEHVIDELEGA